MLAEDDNASNYFMYHKEVKYPIGNKKQNVEKDPRDLVGKSLDNESVRDMLPEHISQDGLF